MADSLKRNILRIIIGELSSPIDSVLDSFEFQTHLSCLDPPEKEQPVRVYEYVANIVPTLSDTVFRNHFRMTRTTFQGLMELLGPVMNVRGAHLPSLECRTLACLWYLGNPDTFRSVANRFGISKGSLHFFVQNFCTMMTSEEILPSLISWPDKQDYQNIAEGFIQKGGLPGVIGALDGTCIRITLPSEFENTYMTEKGYPGFHLQAVCDSNLRFLDVYCAYPGSVPDAKVFKNSPLAEHLNSECPSDYHLLGSSAYYLSSNLLVPFKDDVYLSSAEKLFNDAHSLTHVDIRRAFGLLRGKFRRLQYLDVKKVSRIPSIIVACCVLHNLILKEESFWEEEIKLEVEEKTFPPNSSNYKTGNTALGEAKRQEMVDHILVQ